jgi:carbon-monoxide dehydrogenase iron sulfur subunit
MHKFILVDPEKCIGCRTCALACSFEHEEEFNLSLTRISPLWMSAMGRFVPFTCQQCEDPPCLKACPRQAIRVDDKTGAKIVHKELCIGCRTCFVVCPFGIPVVHRNHGFMIKCDLCGGSPACVQECPQEALSLVESDEAAIKKRHEAVKKLVHLMEKVS